MVVISDIFATGNQFFYFNGHFPGVGAVAKLQFYYAKDT